MRSLASFCIRHRRLTLLTWLVLLIGALVGAGAAGERFATNFELPDSDSTRAIELLEDRFPDESGESVQIVMQATDGDFEDGAVAAQAQEALREFAANDEVRAVDDPFARGGTVSEDGTIALATAQMHGKAWDVEPETVSELVDIAEANNGAGLQIELGGDAIRYGQEQEAPASELFGLGAAIIILLITFGSVVAMGLPILTSIIALGTSIGIITVLTNVIDTPDFAPILATMIGLGVGIDYALFIVTRFRAGLREGLEPREAVLTAIDTAGRAVLFAGATVCVALLGLFAIGVSFLHGPAMAAALAVLVTMTASLTLLPAVLSKVGRKIDRFRVPFLKRNHELEGRNWTRWAKAIQRRPWAAAIGSTAVLVALAIPIFSLELGSADAGTDAEDTTPRKAYDLLAEGFGPGFNGPLLVVSEIEPGAESAEALAGLQRDLGQAENVAMVGEPELNPDGDVAVTTVFPGTSPQETETGELVEALRADQIAAFDAETGANTHVGGATAITEDFTEYTAGKLPLFFTVIVLLSALLLLTAFRSVPVAIKAVLMNTLSIGAAFGVVVAIFQWGWGASLIGVDTTAPIDAFLPVMVFAIVFGLSMDYEVFLMSRVHEEWERRKDASGAVMHGLASTGRVITAAAAIMICVFGSFALGGDRTIKLFGVALAGAIFIDAFVIRSLLVPAIMEILGRRAWWLPSWLDRVLPRLHIEAAPDSPGYAGTSGELPPDPLPQTGDGVAADGIGIGNGNGTGPGEEGEPEQPPEQLRS
jgi:putative drug exporter of the RND superfamily